MHSLEHPIMPPDGDGHGGRYESADLDIEALERYFKDTTFEDVQEIQSTLDRTYGMTRSENIEGIEMHMTRIWTRDEIKRGEFKGKPLSGVDPEKVSEININTKEGKAFCLKLYKVFNRNQKYRFEYTLEEAQ